MMMLMMMMTRYQQVRMSPTIVWSNTCAPVHYSVLTNDRNCEIWYSLSGSTRQMQPRQSDEASCYRTGDKAPWDEFTSSRESDTSE